jgi:hypothetical protein
MNSSRGTKQKRRWQPMRAVDWHKDLLSFRDKVTDMRKFDSIPTQPILVLVRVPMLHVEDFVLSTGVVQSRNKSNGMLQSFPVREQLLDELVSWFCTNNRF